MHSTLLHLLLADDDEDDRLFFQDALEELQLVDTFTSVQNGEQLMQFLRRDSEQFPTVLFLDLNMPRKNGLECLLEIKKDERLQHLPVIMYSTSSDQDTINLLYKNGAQHYVRKPSEFSKLKDVIRMALSSLMATVEVRPSKEQFVIQP